MTSAIIYKIMLVTIAGFFVLFSGDELWRHTRYRNQPHRWQWQANKAENRSSDILWLRDRFWMVARLIGALALAAFVAQVLWTHR